MKRSSARRYGFAFILLVILSLACSGQVTVYETPLPPSVETVVAVTFAAITENAPRATDTATPTSLPTLSSPTAKPFGDVYVFTLVENVNLRVQPGMLFQVSRVMPKGTRLQLVGQAPGGEWLNVINDDGINGWVNTNVVQLTAGSPLPPIVQPTNVLLVSAKVETEAGTPVSGIGFSVTQDSRRVDAVTDSVGVFYAYLPVNMSGTWTIAYLSISCTSNVMDSNCVCIGGTCGSAYPKTTTVVLPQANELTFIWK